MCDLALKTLFFSLLISFLHLFHHPTSASPLYHQCSSSTYTLNTTYRTNLNLLLSSLSSKASANNGFYNTTIGENQDQAYGLALCRGDMSSYDCQKCLDEASGEITKQERCPNNRSGIIWYDNCTLHYSDQAFFGQVDVFAGFFMWNIQNTTQPDDSNVDVRALMYPLAANAPSQTLMFAADGSDAEGYGFVQCTRDLSVADCQKCLGAKMERVLECCEAKRGWRMLSSSCMVRYEAVKFLSSPAEPPAVPPAVPPDEVKVEISEESLLNSMGSTSSKIALHDDNQEISYDQSQELPIIDLATILLATNSFSDKNKLGEGGFGPVYKGILRDGKEIAVKRLSVNSEQGTEEFKNEVILIAKLQHRNLVRLLFCSIERKEKLLVYEFMPNTSLDVFLFDPVKRVQLDWQRRQNIVVGIARGLLYLHEDSRLRVIHRDLKASNILLDHDMNPKISDFGMARTFKGNQSEANTNRVVGTYGYMAPEYAMDGLFSVKSDVFSFGVLLLEIVTGKRNIRFNIMEQAQSLLTYAWQLWSSNQGLELIDPLIVDSCPIDEALRYIHIGLLCVQEDAADRPTMSLVVLMLGSEYAALPEPKKPAFYAGKVVSTSGGSSTMEIDMSN
ncbi:cysteine-rich receptor-like protein kinase 10 isoform X2 [Cinnamomum micranthum f. kanehirae]|uniref:non-specific serine/threonine protein kinase n=1 Tax=Cinnamomum micranthum f. kanehirae TaxID=337451 RepID=A0A443PC03_9MAGN|nr:cysteine-rich receptor-like protein kinase 10 isoform X2 [Cinnamomum micranthum f. kanehirae]